MYTVNVSRIIANMYGHGFNRTTLSSKLGISRNTLNAYLSTPEKMPYLIISKMASMICDNSSEAMDIFFETKLSQKESFK